MHADGLRSALALARLAAPQEVVEVRLLPGQLYGFVRLAGAEAATSLLETARALGGVETRGGARLRIARAQGQMPSWKVGRGAVAGTAGGACVAQLPLTCGAGQVGEGRIVALSRAPNLLYCSQNSGNRRRHE
jgi:hypothetical protein